MDLAWIDSCVDGVLRDGRSGRGLDPGLVDKLVKKEVADRLRKRLRHEDAGWILECLRSRQEGVLAFAVAVVRPLQDNDAVRERLFEIWEESLPPRIRVGLVFRLLDYNDLSLAWHDNLYNWVLENERPWRDKATEWYSLGELVENAKERLGNPRFPESKKWMYLLQVARFGTCREALEVLSEYEHSTAPFVAKIAKRLRVDLSHTNEGGEG